MSIATRALTSARDRLKQAEDSYRRSTGNEKTKAKKARCVEVAEYTLKAVERQISEQFNPPLTLDELRHMDGEPVWVVCGAWADWRIPEFINIGAYRGFIRFTDNSAELMEEYGKAWLAYRHRTKEG